MPSRSTVRPVALVLFVVANFGCGGKENENSRALGGAGSSSSSKVAETPGTGGAIRSTVDTRSSAGGTSSEQASAGGEGGRTSDDTPSVGGESSNQTSTGAEGGQGPSSHYVGGSSGAVAASDCVIASTLFRGGTVNPENPCASCQPSVSSSAWVPLADASSCGTGRICHSGACQIGCSASTAYYPAGASHPDNPCLVCQAEPAADPWQAAPDGSSCGTGKGCLKGMCQDGCRIGTEFYAASEPNPADACQTCQPSQTTTEWSDTPSAMCGLAIAVGDRHACALKSGSVLCWGFNGYGALGDGFDEAYSPAPVTSTNMNNGVNTLAVGLRHSCALLKGVASCWGADERGALGNGDGSADVMLPSVVTGLSSKVQKIFAGTNHGCAVEERGELYCWGSNSMSELRASADSSCDAPVRVEGMGANVQTVAFGSAHLCVLSDGRVLCRGGNDHGQLGDGSTTAARTEPVQVQGLAGTVTSISAGSNHTCALVSGSLKCWGDNSRGQLGDGTMTSSPTPVQVIGLTSKVRMVAAGAYRTCAVVDGGVKCWGGGFEGPKVSTPTPVEGLGSGVISVSIADNFGCALTEDGFKCWGRNEAGQLGDGTTTDSAVAVRVVMP